MVPQLSLAQPPNGALLPRTEAIMGLYVTIMDLVGGEHIDLASFRLS